MLEYFVFIIVGKLRDINIRIEKNKMYISPKIMEAFILDWPVTKSESCIIFIVFIVIFSLFMTLLTKPKQDVCRECKMYRRQIRSNIQVWYNINRR